MALPPLLELRSGVSLSSTHYPGINRKLSKLFANPTGRNQQMGDDDETGFR